MKFGSLDSVHEVEFKGNDFVGISNIFTVPWNEAIWEFSEAYILTMGAIFWQCLRYNNRT